MLGSSLTLRQRAGKRVANCRSLSRLGAGRQGSACPAQACRGRPLPAPVPSRPPRLCRSPARPGAGALGQQTPGIDSPRAHFRVPPPAAAIGQWAARRGCRELCRPRPPGPGQSLPSGFASSAARPRCGFVLSLYFSPSSFVCFWFSVLENRTFPSRRGTAEGYSAPRGRSPGEKKPGSKLSSLA